jgi:hypothetical protein
MNRTKVSRMTVFVYCTSLKLVSWCIRVPAQFHKERYVRLSPVLSKGKGLPVQEKYQPSTTAGFVSVLLHATCFGIMEKPS